MSAGDAYRVKAAELRARARREAENVVRDELEALAAAYLLLAEQAERNSHLDICYETPPRRPDQPQAQQQSQAKLKPDK
jgi:hypothetical protein